MVTNENRTVTPTFGICTPRDLKAQIIKQDEIVNLDHVGELSCAPQITWEPKGDRPELGS